MLTATQQHAVDQFGKSLSALGDDALIDTHHQAWEDQREASAEGSDNRPVMARREAPRDRTPQQGLRKESCDRKGDAGSLP
jgi:hypothetical protein